MTTKTTNIINWSLAGVVGFIFISSAMSKFFGGEETLQMAKGIGLSAESFQVIGIVEFVSVMLFFSATNRNNWNTLISCIHGWRNSNTYITWSINNCTRYH